MRRYGPAMVLFLLPFAYDPWAYDVLTAKYGVWMVCVGVWASVRLWEGELPRYSGVAMALLFVLYLPSWVQGASWAHTWVPWSQALALVWWVLLVWDALLQSKEPRVLQTTWLRASAIGLVLLSLLAVVEWWHPQAFVWSGAVRGLSNATMGNPNHLGALLSVGLPIFFVLGGRWRWGALCVVVGIATTGSRLSLLTAYILMALGAISTLCFGGAQTLRERFQTTAWAACCVWALWFGAKQITPQKQIADIAQGRGGISARLHLVRCALPMSQEALPWGLGYGRFRQRFPAHRGRCLKGTIFAKAPLHTVAVNLHNDWLQIALEGGLLVAPMLLAVLLWWGLLFLTSLRMNRPVPSAQSPHFSGNVWLLLPMLGLFVQMGGTFPIQLPSVLALATLCALSAQHAMLCALSTQKVPTGDALRIIIPIHSDLHATRPIRRTLSLVPTQPRASCPTTSHRRCSLWLLFKSCLAMGMLGALVGSDVFCDAGGASRTLACPRDACDGAAFVRCYGTFTTKRIAVPIRTSSFPTRPSTARITPDRTSHRLLATGLCDLSRCPSRPHARRSPSRSSQSSPCPP